MEKHHKLRRPAGSSIHACNICGKEGHQAAQCPNGTVNWAAKFGPAWTSDLDAVKKEPDYKDIAAQAKAFAAKRLAEEEKARWRRAGTRPGATSAGGLRGGGFREFRDAPFRRVRARR